MDYLRRFRRALFIAIGVTCGLGGNVWAQSTPGTYPSQTVRIVVPFGAGSMTDILARVISDKLGQVWKQQVIVENRPGIAGTASVAKAEPDGHTIMLTSNGHAILGRVNANLPFDPINDFAGVSRVASMPMALVVAPDSPAKSLPEFLTMIRAEPGKKSYASAGLGSAAYIAAELVKKSAKIDMVHVPYKGTPDALTSVMRHDTVMFISPAANAVALIESGKVRALAVTGTARFSKLPSVPTFAEAGLSQFSYDAWLGLLAPAKTSPAILKKISQDIAAVLKMPEVQETLSKQGITPGVSTPEEFTMLVKSDTARFGELLPNPQK